MSPGLEEPQGWVLPAGDQDGVPHRPPCLSLWCYGPCHPSGDRGGLSPTVSLSRWGQNWGPCSSTAQVLPPFPPSSARGCTFKTFCIYFAFYYL